MEYMNFKNQLKKLSVQAMYVSNLTNIRYLTGYNGTFAKLLLTKSKGYLFTDSRYIEAANKLPKSKVCRMDNLEIVLLDSTFKDKWNRALKKHKVEKLGFENSMSIAQLNMLKKMSDIKSFKGTSGMIEGLRIQKHKDEIRHIQKAQDITDQIFTAVKPLIKTGMTEKNIAWKIRELANKFGADDLSFETIVGINQNSATPHHHPTNKKFKKGDLVLIDMGVKVNGYCSDMTRTILPKKPSEQQKKVYNAVLEAQLEAMKIIKPGVRTAKADMRAREVIKNAGYEGKFTHSLGHGVGLDIHEAPGLSNKSEDILQENSVVTVEPGIYLPGKFGVRIEDMGLVTKSGYKNFTKSIK